MLLPLLLIDFENTAEPWLPAFHFKFLEAFFPVLLHEVIFVEVDIVFSALLQLL